MTVYGFLGYKGDGKTISLVATAYLMAIQKKRIFSNIKLSFKYQWLNAIDIVELSPVFDNSFVLIDELHMLADSRTAPSLQNRCLSYFFLQSRHRDCDIGYTTQLARQVDRRIQDNTDVQIICKNLEHDSDGDGIDDLFQLLVVDLRHDTVRKMYLYGKPIFNKYDTKEIVNPFVYIDKKTLSKRIQEMQDKIYKQNKKRGLTK